MQSVTKDNWRYILINNALLNNADGLNGEANLTFDGTIASTR